MSSHLIALSGQGRRRLRKQKRLSPEDSKKLERALKKPPGEMFNRQTARGRRNHGLLLINYLTGCRGISLVRMKVKDLEVFQDKAGKFSHVKIWLLMKRKPRKPKVKWCPESKAVPVKDWIKAHGFVDYEKATLKIEAGKVWTGTLQESKPVDPHEVEIKFRGKQGQELAKFKERRPGGRDPEDPLFCRLNTAGDPVGPEDPLFYKTDKHSLPGGITRNGVFYTFRKFAEAVGIPGLTPHAVRHTMASELAEAGASLREIQRVMGHCTPAMAQVYIDELEEIEPLELLKKGGGK